MKFVPRQPQPPPSRPASSTATRFLRLQPAEDAPSLAEKAKFEPRSLPAFADPVARTPSQRVRLHLDPQIASQPLPLPPPAPESLVAEIDPEPLGEELPAEGESDISAEAAAPSVGPEITEATEIFEPQTSFAESDAELTGEPLVEEEPLLEQAESTPPPEIFEMPPSAETMKKAWFPPPPTRSSTVPLWTSITPAFQMMDALPPTPEDPGSRPSLNFSTRRKTAPVPLPLRKTKTAPVSVPLSRPELRRPTPSLAHLSRSRQPLGAGFWMFLALVLIAFTAVLGYFVVAPLLAHPGGAVAVVKTPPRPVSFVVAARSTPVTELPVSGMVEPSRETAIYARTTGYVRSWLVDIGDKVQANQVLAELDTPEVDHELVQARAASDQAKANLVLAQNEADRWTTMAGTHAVSQQDADAHIAARNAAQANFNAAEANVGRLVDLESFKEIRAPYAGTITERNLELGSLVGSGPGPAGSELFRLIETDPVRVFVNVPEANAPGIHAGVPAKLEVPDAPNHVFTGSVVRDAGALDRQSHMLRTEVHVANPDGALLPGMAADVRLLLVGKSSALLVPANTLITGNAGPAVVRIVPSDGREVARFTAVKVGRSFGADVEIVANLKDGDRLVANPPSDLRDGMVVDARPFMPAAPESIPMLLPPKPSAPRA